MKLDPYGSIGFIIMLIFAIPAAIILVYAVIYLWYFISKLVGGNG